ncbi:MAG: hypothetical protein HKO59_00155 [Phycisphaerales bacterium]|nr:hypothetical protein [Phycisphaerae bacterium]NNF42434.1 hypothetical protein [Phycisphaerales bacterium]NNM24394.1 hypothetical protein [Phycisphaerales bacterium]
MHPRTAFATTLVGLTLAFASGCLVVSGKSIDEHGTLVTANTLSQIEPGVTTEAWVLATLGEPTAITTVPGTPDVSILRYDYVEEHAEGGAVFLIFAGGSETRHVTRTYFESAGGVITKYWTEP